jgi:hypothetical protein
MGKYIVVVAENKTQFQDYVDRQLEKKQIELVKSQRPNKIELEQVTFLWVKDEYQLRGYSLPENSQLLLVGSWYNISQETLDKIQNSFKLRMVK